MMSGLFDNRDSEITFFYFATIRDTMIQFFFLRSENNLSVSFAKIPPTKEIGL
ncbi:hypothetical protein BDD30_0068 [Photorhabdus asymbiotica]|uniref:Uncharacterized protein n=1 Tax=Photorhabdus asymbiotica TaxID=291112 RepID=A0ABX9SQS8_9GAMM|nr:hypothetical protein BDD30_0068 [Photorhabdus asymbiotica]